MVPIECLKLILEFVSPEELVRAGWARPNRLGRRFNDYIYLRTLVLKPPLTVAMLYPFSTTILPAAVREHWIWDELAASNAVLAGGFIARALLGRPYSPFCCDIDVFFLSFAAATRFCDRLLARGICLYLLDDGRILEFRLEGIPYLFQVIPTDSGHLGRLLGAFDTAHNKGFVYRGRGWMLPDTRWSIERRVAIFYDQWVRNCRLYKAQDLGLKLPLDSAALAACNHLKIKYYWPVQQSPTFSLELSRQYFTGQSNHQMTELENQTYFIAGVTLETRAFWLPQTDEF